MTGIDTISKARSPQPAARSPQPAARSPQAVVSSLRGWRSRAAVFLMHLPGWVFAVSCLAKLIWPEVTLRVLAEVWGFGRPVSLGLFAALVALEAALALLLITGWRPRWSLAAAGIFLVGVTASPVLQAMTGSELSCGCGLSAEAATTPLAHWFVVGRNAFLVALGGLCVMFIPPLSE